jgi:transcriptional regulator with XRE-family HTH domain
MTFRTREELGSAIADLRRTCELSQRGLAEAVGLDQSAISRLEAGNRDVGAAELYEIASALGVRPDDLLMQPTAEVLRLRAGDADDASISHGSALFEEAVADYFAAMALADLP